MLAAVSLQHEREVFFFQVVNLQQDERARRAFLLPCLCFFFLPRYGFQVRQAFPNLFIDLNAF